MQPETVNIKIGDEALVEQCVAGDSAALERLIIKYQDRLFNVVLRICGNRDTAAELTQDAFVKIIEHIGRFEGRSSFYTWAFRIAVNLTLNYCKRQMTQKPVSMDAIEVGVANEAKQSLRSEAELAGQHRPGIVQKIEHEERQEPLRFAATPKRRPEYGLLPGAAAAEV